MHFCINKFNMKRNYQGNYIPYTLINRDNLIRLIDELKNNFKDLDINYLSKTGLTRVNNILDLDHLYFGLNEKLLLKIGNVDAIVISSENNKNFTFKILDYNITEKDFKIILKILYNNNLYNSFTLLQSKVYKRFLIILLSGFFIGLISSIFYRLGDFDALLVIISGGIIQLISIMYYIISIKRQYYIIRKLKIK